MGIKLRVRVVGGSGDTIRVEVPEVCTLAQLRSALATKVFEGNVEPANVAVTLNRTDDVSTQGSGEGSTLRSCGIARGDLVYVFVRDAAAATTRSGTAKVRIVGCVPQARRRDERSEEHTSELQSP